MLLIIPLLFVTYKLILNFYTYTWCLENHPVCIFFPLHFFRINSKRENSKVQKLNTFSVFLDILFNYFPKGFFKFVSSMKKDKFHFTHILMVISFIFIQLL